MWFFESAKAIPAPVAVGLVLSCLSIGISFLSLLQRVPTSESPTELNPVCFGLPVATRIILHLCGLGFLSSLLFYKYDPNSPVPVIPIFIGIFALFLVTSEYSHLRDRVEVWPDRIRVRKLLRWQSYPIADIERVWVAGSGVYIKIRNGGVHSNSILIRSPWKLVALLEYLRARQQSNAPGARRTIEEG